MDEDLQREDVRKSRVMRVTNAAEGARILPFKNQIYEQLKAECLKSKKLFEDPLFTATDANMFYTQAVPTGVTWKRPKDICAAPEFITKLMHVGDLDQGYLGDCWFVAACASIVLVPELVAKVVPDNQQCKGADYAGIFHFRFWYYGDWVDVVVDDRLPVWPDGKLLFCRNKQEPNEFWAALLEKAYAKLCGCYENLDGGTTTEALIDMSGGIEESFTIKSMQTSAQRDELWDIIVKSRKHKTMIGASIAPNPSLREARLSNGLVMGHAYTVTKIALLEINGKEVRLVRVRNPWGNEVEWKGSWGDASTEWRALSADIKKALDYSNMPDGEFWMNYEDFYRNFENVSFCDLSPDAFSAELQMKRPAKGPQLSWKLTAYNGLWQPGVSSGGAGVGGTETQYWTNPQFLVTLTQPDLDDADKLSGQNDGLCTIIIALMQKYTREARMKNGGEPCEQVSTSHLHNS